MELMTSDGGKKSLWEINLLSERAVETNKICNIFEGSNEFFKRPLSGCFRPFHYSQDLVHVFLGYRSYLT